MLHSRQKRLEDQLRDTLSAIFVREVRDHRLPRIMTLTKVVITRDMRHATVHYSQLPDDDAAVEKCHEFLAESAGYLRGLVSRELNLKVSPQLHFRFDEGERNFQKVNRSLQALKKAGENLDPLPEPEKEEES